MPDMPAGGDNWAVWIITTILAALSGAVTTIIGLARMIQSQYQTTIDTIKHEFDAFKVEANAEIKALRMTCDAQWKEISACTQDRAALAAKIEMSDRDRDQIKSRLNNTEQKVNDLQRGTQ